MTKFKVGDKVVPISKTVGWNTLNRVKDHLNESGTWNRALSNEQTFLYVNRIDKFRNLYICSNECGGGGDYFHETDLTPYKTKPTKNQRITALEDTVAKQSEEINELKLIVHELRDGRKTMRDVMNEVLSEPSTTNTVEDIIEFEGQQYRKVDREGSKGDVVIFRNNNTRFFTNGEPYKVAANGCPVDNEKEAVLPLYSPGHGRTSKTVDVYELIKSEPLTPNQQRAAIIEKAKAFIDKHDKATHINIHDNTIIAYKLDTADFGISKCNPNDVFNEHIGKAIALGRALGLDVSEFEQVVQPTEQEVGQILTFPKGDSWHKRHNYRIDGPTVDCGNLTVVYNEVDQLDHRVGKKSYGPFTKGVIINDTNAKYEEGSN